MALTQKSVLQRRTNLSNTIQAALDGVAVISISFLLVDFQVGYMTTSYALMLLLLLGVLAVVYDQLGVYRSNKKFMAKTINLAEAWTLSFMLMFMIAFLAGQTEGYSRLVIGGIYFFGLIAQILLHLLVKTTQERWVKDASNRENVLIIGQGQLAGMLVQRISSNPWLAQNISGFVSTNSSETETNIEGIPLLGGVQDIPQLVDQHNIRTVYIVTTLSSAKVLEDVYFTLVDKYVTVHWIPDIFALRLINYHVKEIAGIPLITLSETPLVGTRLAMKFLEDMILAFLILVLVSPIMLLIALAIKFDSRGPVFFRQDRTGWNGQKFRIWKFRSMYVHPPENNVVKQAEKDDPRITRVGAFLRKTSLDELPQLLNVLSGHMSLVGPRPHAIQHDQEYSQRIGDYFARQNIKPGMTGLAQVRGYRGETKDISLMSQRIDADIEYINNWSVWLDLMILFKTFSALTGKNAY